MLTWIFHFLTIMVSLDLICVLRAISSISVNPAWEFTLWLRYWNWAVSLLVFGLNDILVPVVWGLSTGLGCWGFWGRCASCVGGVDNSWWVRLSKSGVRGGGVGSSIDLNLSTIGSHLNWVTLIVSLWNLNSFFSFSGNVVLSSMCLG